MKEKRIKLHMVAKYLGVKPLTISNWKAGLKMENGIVTKGDEGVMRKYDLIIRGYREVMREN